LLVAVDGVPSKEAVKEPVCVGMPCDCQVVELTKQPGLFTVRIKFVVCVTLPVAVTVMV
jgi:hypothetical protein